MVYKAVGMTELCEILHTALYLLIYPHWFHGWFQFTPPGPVVEVKQPKKHVDHSTDSYETHWKIIAFSHLFQGHRELPT